MAKQSAYLARIQRAQAYRDEEVRRSTRTFQMDLVTLALGRMGWRESKFREFDRVLAEVADESTTARPIPNCGIPRTSWIGNSSSTPDPFSPHMKKDMRRSDRNAL